jgi:uncharacterized protein (TIGR03067 family)
VRTFAYIATVVVLATALLSGCSDQEEHSDIDRLQGNWEKVYAELVSKPKPGFKKQKLVIQGDMLTSKRGDEVEFKGRITLDPSKNPKTLDMELAEDAHGYKKGQVSQGIYMIEGDTLKWCNAAPGADDRPSEFSNNVEKNHMLIVLKREKK